MIIAMFLAHLVGDYILQWDELALWKSREYKGVLVHSLIVSLITLLFALPFDTGFLPWVLFICVTHLLVDAAQLPLNRRLAGVQNGYLNLGRFLLDQLIHFTVIIVALIGGGYLNWGAATSTVLETFAANRMLTYLLAYAFISMPTWILVEFLVYGLINGSAPDFSLATNKYVGILERWLITTFVVLGQFLLVPLVAAPRLFFERSDIQGRRRMTIYVAELLASIAVATLIGVALRNL
ncbi:MAG: DUF3307 domain-containing protein [Anaerolineales bacterium]|nr:DUF3307 domain-containing protein [Anaerolineales bacterium]